MSGFTHFNEDGNAVMVDVGEKAETKREALASGVIRMSEECFQKVKEGSMKKGDVLGVARIAGIMGAKKTAELIPLCHLLNLTKVEIDFEYLEGAWDPGNLPHGMYWQDRCGNGSTDWGKYRSSYNL